MPETVTIRIHPETRERLKRLAREVGVSQINVIRALAFATAADFRRLESKRLQAREKA